MGVVTNEPTLPPVHSTLVLADSFRVRVTPGNGGEVRGFDRHIDRFQRGVHEIAGQSTEAAAWVEQHLSPFIAGLPARIAAGGEGFPRIELWRDGPGTFHLSLATRPLPPLGEALRMVSVPVHGLTDSPLAVPSPTTPWLKGPNITLFAEVNQRLGAEALFTDAAGNVIEGSTTSLIWWPGEAGSPQLGYVSSASERVASVTEALVREATPGLGYPMLRPGTATPADLAHAEVWAVNALHGIRPVTHVDGAPTAPPLPGRIGVFRAALDQTWQPLAACRERKATSE